MIQIERLIILLITASIQYLAAGAPLSIRGSAASGDRSNNDPANAERNLRPKNIRKIKRRMECKIFLQDIEYGATEDEPNGRSEESWFCEVTEEDAKELDGVRYVKIEGFDDFLAEVTSGRATLIVTEAIINTKKATMKVPETAIYDLIQEKVPDDTKKKNKRRELLSTKGTLQTLVVRVSDSQGVAPKASATQLRSDVFLDNVSLKTQYDECSYGKLNIKPFTGRTERGKYINDGVVDVKINFDTSRSNDVGELQARAMDGAFQQVGDLFDDRFDLVMFCMPPGTGDWLAYAFVNNRFSFYNNDWCSYVSAQMHEVGHNLGLAHSGKLGVGQYADSSGIMGFSYPVDDMRMCFNPAKSYQLGWYSDQVKSFNPLYERAMPVRTFKLYGVADYGREKDTYIVLNLDQSKGGSRKDYFIGFNRKDGMNSDTILNENTVTIVRKDDGEPNEFGQSTLVSALKIGDSYTIYNFNGMGDVEIRFIAGGFSNRYAVVQVRDVKRALETEVQAPCKSFTVEVKTDNYPKDNHFTVRETTNIGQVYASGFEYSKKNAFYSKKICIPYGKNYRFDMYDQYGDGMCCSQGEGYYRVKDDRGRVIFGGDRGFRVKTNYFSVGSDPNPQAAVLDTDSECENKKKRFQYIPKGKTKPTKKRTCSGIAKRNLCDSKDVDGIRMWKHCPKACDRCDDE